MPTPRSGRGHGARGRHGGGRGRLPVAVQPREGGETLQTCATGERMVRSGPCPPRAAPSGPAERDPYRNQPSRSGSGAPPPSSPGAEPVPYVDSVFQSALCISHPSRVELLFLFCLSGHLVRDGSPLDRRTISL
jgi:hypothetical protein